MRILHIGWGFYPWRPGGLIAYAEDLMESQAERGHEVSYFFSGRHYPFVSGPRLKRWRRRGVGMYEVVNPPVVAGLEAGTRRPELEVSEPRTEAAFGRLLAELRPDAIHIQELHGLPTSLIDVAADAGVPTLMTLQDYYPLCATLRLFDSDGRICMRTEVGADCVARNAGAPADAGPLALRTVQFELERAGAPALAIRIGGRLLRAAGVGTTGPSEPSRPGLAESFQRRREVNVERLARVDRLVAQSPRVAEIYRALGVPAERLSTLTFRPRHIERLRPRILSAPPAPVRFVTLNGCASRSKGAETVLAALRALRAAGVGGGLRLTVLGYVDPSARNELDGFDVGLVPSMWEEPFPGTGLELVAKGIPLIANPLGGIVEYAREGETAWLNESCSGEGMAQIMLTLMREPELVLERHRRLLAVRDELMSPWEPHVDAMEALYREIASPE
jgi:glycosyltransferase involved in cell wall biosynthesis